MIVVAALLRRVSTSVITWLGSLSFWQLACLVLFCFAALQTVRVSGEKRHSAKVEARLLKCNQARQADRESYVKAQAEAQAKNQQQISHVKQQQETITDEVRDDLNSRLERIRRELRNPAPQSSSQGPGAGNTGPAPEGADGSTRMYLSPEERLRAAENEERHDQLITWVERQSKIDPNK